MIRTGLAVRHRPRWARLRIDVLYLALAGVMNAQQPQLRVVIVEGEDALNNTQTGLNRDVTVEVRGPDQMPVSGATVTFVLPDAGASGTFANGQRTLMVETNNQGRATASGIRANNIAGPMQIRVTAAYMGIVATAVVRQTNVSVAVPGQAKPPPAQPKETAGTRPSPAATGTAPPKQGMSKTSKLILVLAIVGGAAAGGIAVGAGGGSSPGTSTPPPPVAIVITPGTPSVGGPP